MEIHSRDPHLPEMNAYTEIIEDFVRIDSVDEERKKLIAFINPKSGGGQGIDLIHKFSKLLPPTNVFDLMEQNGPEKGIELFKETKDLRIIAAGGDGTGRWVLETLDKYDFENYPEPPVGILPLGTGNDIGRAFGWGGGYSGESVESLIRDFTDAKVVKLDRWKVDILPTQLSFETPPHSSYLNNYLSVGFTDAKIALDFHKMREENPHLCKTRAINKMWYLSYGMKAFSEKIIRDVPHLSEFLSIFVDKKQVDLKDIEGVIILNLPSYAGGTDMWGPVDPSDINQYKHVSYNDGLIEVIGVRSVIHLGSIMTGVSKGVRLGQGSSVLLEYFDNKYPLPGKIDGEPWLQTFPCSIQIHHFKQSPMLLRKEWQNALASFGEYKMAGYLEKTSFRMKFRRRFYILTLSGRLFYYVNQQSGGPKGEIKLPSSSEEVKKGQTVTSFTIVDPMKKFTYDIRCPSEELRDEWVEKIKEVICSAL